MKYIVIIGDGMADRPLKELGGRTPLQKAHTPAMDRLASMGTIGTVRTIPEGMPPGSDVANLSILGYNPRKFYTGRAPLEAASIGVELSERDVAYRCNLVTLYYKEGSPRRAVMDDYSSGHITTDEAEALINALNTRLSNSSIVFHSGVSYRHLMIWKNGKSAVECVPPHDILGKEIIDYLPVGDGEDVLRHLMESSNEILQTHPVNAERLKHNKKPANSIWLWGQGSKPHIATYKEKYGLSGALVSAVDLTKGLGIYAGFEILNVPGVTGWLDTNYAGKAEAALKALEKVDLVYIHVEAPDEAGHSGNYKDKIKAIEDFDALVVNKVLNGIEKFKECKILLMPDHPTPIEIRTHTDEPVPFVIYDKQHSKKNSGVVFDESIAQRNDRMIVDEGYQLMDYFIEGER